MYKLYTIDNKKRSRVKGFWLDDNKKLYIDNVFIKRYNSKDKFRQGIKALFIQGEKSIFYTQGKRAFLEDNKGKVDVLRHRLRLRRSRLSGQEIKGLLRLYGGITIYNYKSIVGYYIIEVYHN